MAVAAGSSADADKLVDRAGQEQLVCSETDGAGRKVWGMGQRGDLSGKCTCWIIFLIFFVLPSPQTYASHIAGMGPRKPIGHQLFYEEVNKNIFTYFWQAS